MEKLKPYKACMKDKRLWGNRGTGRLKVLRRVGKQQARNGNYEVSPISVGWWD